MSSRLKNALVRKNGPMNFVGSRPATGHWALTNGQFRQAILDAALSDVASQRATTVTVIRDAGETLGLCGFGFSGTLFDTPKPGNDSSHAPVVPVLVKLQHVEQYVHWIDKLRTRDLETVKSILDRYLHDPESQCRMLQAPEWSARFLAALALCGLEEGVIIIVLGAPEFPLMELEAVWLAGDQAAPPAFIEIPVRAEDP